MCDIWQPVKFKLVSRFWTGSFFLLYLWINVGNIFLRDMTKKIISFQERENNWNFTGCQVPHFMIVLIPYINLLNLSWVFAGYTDLIVGSVVRCLVNSNEDIQEEL